MKNEKRGAMSLPPLTENTHEVCRHMRASSPPASAADLIEAQQQPRRNGRGIKKVGRDIWWENCVLQGYSLHHSFIQYLVVAVVTIFKKNLIVDSLLRVIQVLRNARGGGWVYAQALRSVTRGTVGYVSVT